VKKLFAYVELENIHRTLLDEDQWKSKWDQTILLGAGWRFKVASFIKLQTIVGIDALYFSNDIPLSAIPVTFKTGIRFVK